MKTRLPRLLKSLDYGDSVLEMSCDNGKTLRAIDRRCVVAVHQQDESACVQFVGGIIVTDHSYGDLMELLFPYEEESDA